ncbi:MAG: tetratricopeptide repeat protein [Patescibacteria group bacterium]|jgi:tetratricopeptide (TPR) repeat protein
MFWWIIPTILLVVSLATAAAIVWRKIPQLRILNTAALPAEKIRHVKDLILEQRFQRAMKEKFGFLAKLGVKLWTEFNRYGRRLVQKVYSVEQHYRKLQKNTSPVSADAEIIRKMMEEAEELIDKEEYFEAEKKYIEILSQHPKHVKAYEALGHLYIFDRKFEQARETFAFALKLNPNDASVHAALGELETKDGNPAAALTAFAKAAEIRPNSPRYLDFLIEAAIAAGNAAEAQRGLNKLKEVNPENQKLSDFEERISGLGK